MTGDDQLWGDSQQTRTTISLQPLQCMCWVYIHVKPDLHLVAASSSSSSLPVISITQSHSFDFEAMNCSSAAAICGSPQINIAFDCISWTHCPAHSGSLHCPVKHRASGWTTPPVYLFFLLVFPLTSSIWLVNVWIVFIVIIVILFFKI